MAESVRVVIVVGQEPNYLFEKNKQPNKEKPINFHNSVWAVM